MTKFGIGIITTGDRTLHENYLKLLDQSQPTVFSVQVDQRRRGIAPTRNRAMKELYDAGCQDIVLFDDDCWPIKEGWQQYLVDTQYASGSHALLLPKDDPYIGEGVGDGSANLMRWGVGAFMYLTRELIDTIGYLNTRYDTYGYEDVAYLWRARNCRLSLTSEFDIAPRRIQDYIYSIDCDKSGNAVSNGTTLTQKQKNAYIEKNTRAFQEEIARGVKYYPFDGGND